MALPRWLRPSFLRSLAAGSAATLADLVVLTALIGLAGVHPRLANAPSLLAGALVQFLGNRYFAFDGAEQRSARRQAVLFGLTELVALGANGLLYDTVARSVALDAGGSVVARLATSFAVFALWSYPLWRLVFGAPRSAVAAGQA